MKAPDPYHWILTSCSGVFRNVRVLLPILLLQETRCKSGRTSAINAKVRATKSHWNFSQQRHCFVMFGCIWEHFVMLEPECPIFRWVGINSTWRKMTLTIRLRRASPKCQCNRWTNSLWLPTLLMQDQPDHEDCFLSTIEEWTRKRCEQSNYHSKVEFWIHEDSAVLC